MEGNFFWLVLSAYTKHIYLFNQVEKEAEEERALRASASEERDSLQKEVLALKMETQKKDIRQEELQKEVDPAGCFLSHFFPYPELEL